MVVVDDECEKLLINRFISRFPNIIYDRDSAKSLENQNTSSYLFQKEFSSLLEKITTYILRMR